MQVLIENGSYHMFNMGDVAMLQVTLMRFQERWPGARLHVLTLTPERIRLLCPEAIPLESQARHVWQTARFLPVPWRLSKRYSQQVESAERLLQARFPRMAHLGKRRFAHASRTKMIQMEAFFKAICDANAVVTSGGGFLNDLFPQHAMAVLDTLALAQQMGKPTAMFGQGLGPMEDPDLRAKAARVLPSLKVLALREGRASIPLLRSLGVPLDNVVVTGDDSIELAYRDRALRRGSGIGINLRLAKYAPVPDDALPVVRAVLREVARQWSAPLIPVPVMLPGGPHQDDLSSVQELLEQESVDYQKAQCIETPLDLIRQVGRCRVVVSVSYHSAVFALAQGIPVVGLAKSEYYVNKLSGLADQFGTSCTVILLDAPDLKLRLARALEEAWHRSPQVRQGLIAAAERQIEVSRAAYRQFLEWVNE